VTVNWSVDLGQILSVVAMVLLAIGAHFAVKQTVTVVVARFDDFKLSMENTVKAFGVRLDKHEASIMGLVGDVQRMVGRVDGQMDRQDRKDARK
jgi:hypothetical protein